MERLNWALLGLMGIITALGLTTSSGAGKTSVNEQPLSVSASTSAPACDACKIAQAEASLKISATPISSDEVCPGNCHETGVCCDKSLPKSETAVAAKTETHACEGECCLNKKSDQVAVATPSANAVCEGECCLSKKATATAEATTSADCPLTKAAEMIENLTKNYVCEGGECLTKPAQGTLILKNIDEPAKPEGLSNLLAAAEVTAAAQSDQGPMSSSITISGDDLTKAGTGTLTLNFQASDAKPAVAIVADAKVAEAKTPSDNSRAAARAAKLAKIEEKMAQPWTLAFNETPLTQALAAVQEKYGVPVLLDMRAIEEIAFDTATPLTADQQPEIEAGELLRGLLRNHGLTWMIPASNDRVLITTITAMENTPIRRVYVVTDMIGEDPDTLLQQLVSILTPITWVDGNNSNLLIRNNGSSYYLLATHDYWSQQELKMLLEDLRLQATGK